MDTVLDLDLDFFVWPIAVWPDEGRRSESEYRHASEQDVRHFLEQHCHLDKSKKIPGRQFTEHRDAFAVWLQWLNEGTLSSPFTVFHVDAHADLGQGSSGWIYLLSELLAMPLANRRNPRIDRDALNSGNYLAYAIANQWISSLICVYPNALWTRQMGPCLHNDKNEELRGRPPDLMSLFFRNGDTATGLIELRHFSAADVKWLTNRSDLTPIHTEPAVPFTFTSEGKLDHRGFTHMVVAESPQYTPPSTDQLLPVIQEYFTPS
jgi:UPF0489 domain